MRKLLIIGMVVLGLAVFFLCVGNSVKLSWPEDGVIAQFGDGYLEVVQGTPVLHLKGDPYTMGLQHGTLMKEYLERGRALMNAHMMRNAELESKARALDEHTPEKYKLEMQGLADGAGWSYEDVLYYQVYGNIVRMNQCSQFVVLPELTEEGLGTIHGRNLDTLGGSIAQSYFVIQVVHPEEGIPFIAIQTMGSVGVATGINAEGLVLALNDSTGMSSLDGMSYFFQMREAIETCTDVESAVDYFANQVQTMGMNVGMSDPGAAAVVEIAYAYFKVRRPSPSWVAVTNHFQPVYDEYNFHCWRYPILHRTLVELSQENRFSVADATQLLGQVAFSHSYVPYLNGNSSTLVSVVFLPGEREFWLTMRGIPATRKEFSKFAIDELLRSR